MAGINTGKVIVGGLAGGVVMNVIDFVSNTYIMKDRMKADIDALNPSLWAKMEGGSTIATFVTLDFIWAILVVWLYAAIRPRFGPGGATAMKAGLITWAFGAIAWFGFVSMGFFSMSNYPLGAGIALVNSLLSAYVGAMLYKED